MWQTAHVDVVVLNGIAHAPNLDAIIVSLQSLCRDDGTILILATTLGTLDVDFAALARFEEAGSPAQWLCDPEPSDWEAALDGIIRQRTSGCTLQDSGGESARAQLQHLSEEVDRLSRTLKTLRFPKGKAEGGAERYDNITEEATEYAQFNDEEPLTAQKLRTLLRARRQRDKFFGEDLFADPAWDMILDLMAARLAGERVSVSSLCIAAAVPPTTALRWIRHLTQLGLFERQPDTQDGRRVFIALSDKAAAAVHRWYAWSLQPRLDGYD
ncbi:MAG: winged helix DNA-binding protein [Sphingobium sp.]